MTTSRFLALAVIFLLSAAAHAAKPNVVLIVCDDLNDYVEGLEGHPQAKTPNMKRLADSGVTFIHAYSNNPVCAPSRASFLTGIYPHTSGNLFWDEWFKNPVLGSSKTIMEHFRDNGYHTAGTGKMMHHPKKSTWNEYKYKADYGPFVFDGKDRIAHPSVPAPFNSIGAVDGSYASLDDTPFANDNNPKTGWIYGDWGKVKPLRYKSPDDRDPTPDERNAVWAASRIKKFATEDTSKPFFLGIGFIRPHTPLHVPQKYFDLFPIDSVEMPAIKPQDAADTHLKDVFTADQKGLRYFRLLGESYPEMEDGIKAFTQAYLASVAAVDDCIGQVLDAIDASPFKDNTIVIITSDHGWNMGQKEYLFKNSPWEESTRVPFIVRAPGVAKAAGVAKHPISLIDLYPTLVDLCDLQGDTRKNQEGAELDGHSIRPFLEDPTNGTWDGPDGAISMIYASEDSTKKQTQKQTQSAADQHWTLRTERWRYIRYNNGMEELYDHEADPHEWNNLVKNPEYNSIKTQLAKQLSHRISQK